MARSGSAPSPVTRLFYCPEKRDPGPVVKTNFKRALWLKVTEDASQSAAQRGAHPGHNSVNVLARSPVTSLSNARAGSQMTSLPPDDVTAVINTHPVEVRAKRTGLHFAEVASGHRKEKVRVPHKPPISE